MLWLNIAGPGKKTNQQIKGAFIWDGVCLAMMLNHPLPPPWGGSAGRQGV
jgi:hypothetical protein